MSQYAVYQVGHSIFGVGETPAEARTDAAKWLGDWKAAAAPMYSRRRYAIGNIVVMPCTAALAKQVADKGGLGGFLAIDGGLCTIEESDAL